jgi:putative redox protein
MGVDSAGETGQSPMQLLLMAVAGCMAIDVVLILQKSRVPLSGLEVNAVGVRADETPKRYVSVRLEYLVTGPGDDDMAKVDRSIELSRDKYCSVLHTLDPELDFDVSVQRG